MPSSAGRRPTLPDGFLSRMRELLAGEVEDLVASLDLPRSRGLRINPAKTTAAELAALLPVELAPSPASPVGLVVSGGSGLGAHPAHRAGLFYLQDPSAMVPVEVMAPAAGWRVADVAAAPGGKTTHLLGRVGEEGMVVANDVSASRLRALHENLDRWGSASVATCTLPLDRLGGWAPGAFDAALLDAPCSGEGLFRREPEAILQWSDALIAGCARRQSRLLDQTADLVRPGGSLVYSTCTFEVEENEAQIAGFLERHADWALEPTGPVTGARPGLAAPGVEAGATLRIYPQDGLGDGQFVALLRRVDGPPPEPEPPARRGRGRGGAERESVARWERFRRESCPGLTLDPGRVVARGTAVWYACDLGSGLERMARPGMPLGVARPGRFQPSQALACHLRPEDAALRHDLAPEDPRLDRFLHGEELESAGPDGWVLVCYGRWGLGWGRRSQGTLKNHLPRELRS
ncbi:MAG TPA: RsmB/NOP family class I SAM-dependent RNA methyltransferase [Candidatus Dormibacteraeota bacterium]|jgi:16S rRNA C967 or C1407 C5-methylase (RsmB/RsmF family)/NOL1/NOP2/fmu family ribosome biogenesis protein|nr:RsmB/NOP family class I SAM-dependent RNA methyltransferase [Candidatus Dormibacteraeota bacterium]